MPGSVGRSLELSLSLKREVPGGRRGRVLLETSELRRAAVRL
jgi:hypothetical protein